MSILRNPVVVVGLLLVAVVAVGYQVRQHWPGAQAPRPQLEAPAAPAPAPAFTSAPAPALTPLASNSTPPELWMETDYLQEHFGSSTKLPLRDPFWTETAVRAERTNAVAVLQFKLKSIWRQTGSRLAAINNGIFAEGDLIEGYTIERIESDRVLLQGPTGLESLGFTKPQPAHPAPAGTNAIARPATLQEPLPPRPGTPMPVPQKPMPLPNK